MRRHILLALSIAAALAGAYLFYGVMRRYEFRDVMDSLASLAPRHAALMLLLTVASFVCIACMEALAVRYAEKGDARKGPVPVSPARIWRTAVAAIGIGHSLGLAALSSGAIRYRMYGRRGLGLTAISEIVVFSGISVMLGLGLVGGVALFWHAEALAKLLELPATALYAVGAAGLLFCAAYLVACRLVNKPLRIFRYRLRLPGWRIAVAQTAFSSLNYACVAGVIYFAITAFADTSYPEVAALYVGSEFSALVAHVPGGWGVLEFVFSRTFSGHGVVGGLLVFRAVYYLLPLFIGLGVWLIDEIAGRRAARTDDHQMKAQNA